MKIWETSYIEKRANIINGKLWADFEEKKWVAVDDMIKLLESKRNISDIAYTHRNKVIDSLIAELSKKNSVENK